MLICLHRLHFHYEAERVTADERVYNRDLPPRLVQMMLDSPELPPAQLAEEHQALLAAEKECLQVCNALCCDESRYCSKDQVSDASSPTQD